MPWVSGYSSTAAVEGPPDVEVPDIIHTSRIKCPGVVRVRYVVAVVGLLGTAVDYLVRYSLSVALVAMVDTPITPPSPIPPNATAPPEPGPSLHVVCPAAVNASGEIVPDHKGEFHWSESDQGIILGTFFWGYFLTKAAGGRIAEIVGPKRTMAASLAVSGVLSLLCPAAARVHPMALAGLRLVMGLVQGPAFPALYAILTRWAPPHELATIVAIAYSGMPLGNMVALGGSGWLVERLGWRWVFWLGGALALAWMPLWMWLVTDTPEQHPYIAACEKRLLAVNLHVQPRRHVPWRQVLGSGRLAVLVLAEFAGSWMGAMIFAEAPTFLTTQIGMTLEQAGYVCLVASGANWVASLVFGRLSDRILQAHVMTKANTRRMLCFVGVSITCGSVLGVALAGCDAALVAILLVLVTMGTANSICTYQLTPVDMAPNYAGTLSGLLGIGNVGGFLAPLVCSRLLQDLDDGWRASFMVAGGLYFTLGLLYVATVQDHVEPWNHYLQIPHHEDPRDEQATGIEGPQGDEKATLVPPY